MGDNDRNLVNFLSSDSGDLNQLMVTKVWSPGNPGGVGSWGQMMEQASRAHIQNLAQAGIATHMILDENLVDPVFAMAKAREMPAVQFAALFENDTLVLGCPDGVPVELRALAQPIEIDATPPQQAPQVPAVARTPPAQDPLEAVYAPAHRAMGAPSREGEILTALQTLTTTMAQQSHDQISALRRLADSIDRRPTEAPELAKIQRSLQAIEAELDEMRRRMQRPAAAPDDGHHAMVAAHHAMAQTVTRMEAVARSLDQTPKPEPSPARTPVSDLLSPLGLGGVDTFELKPDGATTTAQTAEGEAPLVFPAYRRRRARIHKLG